MANEMQQTQWHGGGDIYCIRGPWLFGNRPDNKPPPLYNIYEITTIFNRFCDERHWAWKKFTGTLPDQYIRISNYLDTVYVQKDDEDQWRRGLWKS